MGDGPLYHRKIREELAIVDGNVDDIETSVGTGLGAAVAVVDGNVDDIKTSVGTGLGGKVDNLDADLVVVDGNVDDIKTSVGTGLGGKVDNLDADLVVVDGNVDDIKTSVGTGLGGKVDNLDADLVVTDGKVDNLDADLVVVDGNVDTIVTTTDAIAANNNTILSTLPAAADALVCTDKNDGGASPWGNGAWVQFIANTGANCRLRQIFFFAVSAPDEFEVDVGVGAAGFENVKCCVPFTTSSNTINIQSCPVITTGSRIAVRIRSKGANGKTASIKLAIAS